MIAKSKLKALLTAVKTIEEQFPIGALEELLSTVDEMRDELAEKTEANNERMDTLMEKDELTDKQNDRLAALQDKQEKLEEQSGALDTLYDTLETLKDTMANWEDTTGPIYDLIQEGN